MAGISSAQPVVPLPGWAIGEGGTFDGGTL
jgi:hypothetical protein